jgi:hypothetical protein
MAKLPVKRTVNAKIQKEDILRYWIIRNKSKVYSKKLNSKINDKLTFLATNPTIHNTSSTREKYIRIETYFALFIIERETIVIITFIDARQDPSKLINQS